MTRHRTKQVLWAVGGGFCVLLAGVAVQDGWLTQLVSRSGGNVPGAGGDSALLRETERLDALPADARRAELLQVANGPESVDRHRARYLLAVTALAQQQPQEALNWLQDLETAHPVLAAPILAKRATAYEQLGDSAQAQATWQQLLEAHPNSPVAAEALVALGQIEAAIARFPDHPLTVQVAQERLKENPDQVELLLVIARHGMYLPEFVGTLDRLVDKHASELKPADWEAIAFGFWEKQLYAKAGAAYARAPKTAQNVYRQARGLQLGEKSGAKAAYARLVKAFPDAPESRIGLLRLAKLSDAKQALTHLDQAIQQFPEDAGEALLEKATLLETLGSPKSALTLRKQLLDRYSRTQPAAEFRWQTARSFAAKGDYGNAVKWAEAIFNENPDSDLSPQAIFWKGKWADRANSPDLARRAYEEVIRRYPDSYYAWRAASLLGWNVGDFTSVRNLTPAIERPAQRPPLLAGSDTLKELYRLSQDRDAWRMWQVEFKNAMQPSVEEQYTDGLLRSAVGDYLDGIFMIAFLDQRDRAEDQAQVKALKQRLDYWQALYPFPFQEPIERWSQNRQLNPLLVTALMRQESRFMPGIRSVAGAVGLMQVMPDTAEWIAAQTDIGAYKLNDPDDNIKLGTWYLDYTHREYDGNTMLAIASYNAGPGAVAGWLQERGGVGDPDEFVEAIPYKETRGYVKSVFGNYWNYLRLYNPDIAQQVASLSQVQPKPAQVTF